MELSVIALIVFVSIISIIMSIAMFTKGHKQGDRQDKYSKELSTCMDNPNSGTKIDQYRIDIEKYEEKNSIEIRYLD